MEHRKAAHTPGVLVPNSDWLPSDIDTELVAALEGSEVPASPGNMCSIANSTTMPIQPTKAGVSLCCYLSKRLTVAAARINAHFDPCWRTRTIHR